MKHALPLACLALAGCGAATFTLPAPGEAQKGRYEWRPAAGIEHPRSDFDPVQAAAPRVFRFAQFYYNLYSAHDGAHWTTGLTASLDGLDWNLGRKVLAADSRTWEGERLAAFGAVLVIDGLIHYWYTAGEPAQIGLARSHDGRSWRREEEPVLSPGSEDAWDSGSVGHPALLAAGGEYYLYYVGTDAAARPALGLARSSDGVKFTRLRANPILPLAEAAAPAVWQAYGAYWMLAASERGRTGLFRSADGVAWQPAGLTIETPMPSVLTREGGAAVWFNDGAGFGHGELAWIPQ